MIDFLTNNISWIFSGIGVAAITWVYLLFSKRKEKQQQRVVVNNFIPSPNTSVKQIDIEQLKLHTTILFVDDQPFGVVDVLKEQGWRDTKMIKDITNLDDRLVKKSHIIFVDINGVGTKLFPGKQGIGLANALKTHYPEKKVIIYSAQKTGNRFETELRHVDYLLPKDAEPYNFIELVEKFAKEIHAKGNN